MNKLLAMYHTEFVICTTELRNFQFQFQFQIFMMFETNQFSSDCWVRSN